ncbi:MAG TPA: PQQ-binding-like beta-propeller repeat protein [Ktedonobacteraceae bacterium]|nr:PQQ-binding-like beta-propeller repeat protein [Ktedonobacteraceae bacterium]
MDVSIFIVVGLLCLFGMVACVYGVFVSARRRYTYLFLAVVLLIGSLLSGTRGVSDASVPHQPAPVPATVQLLVRDANGMSSIKASDGSLRWHHTLDVDLLESRWTLSGDILYLALTTKSGTNHLVALRAGDGKQLWSTLLPSALTDYVFAPPLVADSMVYVPVSDRLFALHANNGTLAWQTSLNNLEVYDSGGSQPFAAGDGLLFLGTKEGIFRALRAQDGTQAWSVTVGEDIGLPTLADGLIYLRPQNGHGIVALRVQNGAVLWHFQLPPGEDQVQPLSVASRHIYLSAYDGSEHYAIVALNAQDGKLLWQHTIADESEEPQEVDGIVYVSQPNVLLALRANDGKQLWQHEMQHTNAVGATIYFIGATHNVIFISTEIDTHSNDLGAFPPCLWNCPPKGITALSTSNGSLYWHSESEIYAVLMFGAA